MQRQYLVSRCSYLARQCHVARDPWHEACLSSRVISGIAARCTPCENLDSRLRGNDIIGISVQGRACAQSRAGVRRELAWQFEGPGGILPHPEPRVRREWIRPAGVPAGPGQTAVEMCMARTSLRETLTTRSAFVVLAELTGGPGFSFDPIEKFLEAYRQASARTGG